MSYFIFLAIFLGIPIFCLSILTILDTRKGLQLSPFRKGFPFWAALLLHVVVAVIYTTPWDNYLVATGVWYYHPGLVTGVRLGWVPIEEYIFFILQTIMTGLLLLALARRINEGDQIVNTNRWLFRVLPALLLGICWGWTLFLYVSGWEAGTYLGLILLWALPPIALQFFFGGDILWNEGKVVGLTLLISTIYLCLTDSLAISSGTWTIAPGRSFQIFLAGVLPLEEFVFFLVTNCLIVFGITLLLAKESHVRIKALARKKVIEYS